MNRYLVWRNSLILSSIKSLLRFFNLTLVNQIQEEISMRTFNKECGPSLALAIPSFIFALLTNIIFAVWMVMILGSKLERFALVFSVALMSISGLFYIILGQKNSGRIVELVSCIGLHRWDRIVEICHSSYHYWCNCRSWGRGKIGTDRFSLKKSINPMLILLEQRALARIRSYLNTYLKTQ